jgi:hypothetical protein
VLQEESVMPETTRRVTRIATLDGGAAVNDFGSTDADKTMVLVWDTVDKALEAAVARLVRLYSRLNVSMPDGVFSVVPQSYQARSNSTSALTLLVVQKLSS